MAGELAAAACARGGGEIVPVDSEHSAILQCLGPARPRRCAAPDHHRERRPVPHLDARGHRRRDAGGRAATSDLVDGAQDHRRQRDAREQGARSDRGALSVRPAVRSHRSRRAPAERRALDGRVRGRQRARPDGRAVDGASRPLCADASRTRSRRRGTTIRPGGAFAADVRTGAARRFSGAASRPRGGALGRGRAGGVQRGQRAGGRALSRGKNAICGYRGQHRRGACGARLHER